VIIPLNVYYVILKVNFDIEGGTRTESVLFAVQISDDPKIIGISD